MRNRVYSGVHIREGINLDGALVPYAREYPDMHIAVSLCDARIAGLPTAKEEWFTIAARAHEAA